MDSNEQTLNVFLRPFKMLDNSLRNGVGGSLTVTVTFMIGHGGSSASSYLADPTSPIPSHCAVIILFKSVPVHQLSQLAL